MENIVHEMRHIKKELAELDGLLNAMVVMLFNEGRHAASREEETLASYTVKAHRIVTKLVHDQQEADHMIAGVEKLLLG